MDTQSSRDLLSDLPLNIIHCILELVPIRDAVKTSILSRQWRYKWTSLPHLVFDDKCVSSSGENGSVHFINQALFLHKGPIHKFKLQQSFIKRRDHIDQWLLFLSRNDIRVLILTFENDEYANWYYCLHSSLYSCQNLTHLELFGCKIPPPPPAFKGFLYLRCLFLLQVQVEEPSSTIESLIANSPLLEELTLNFLSTEMRIHAPNLKRFYFMCDTCSGLSFNLPLLVKISVRVLFYYNDFIDEHLQQRSSVCNYTKFFGSLTNLEELTGDFSLLEYLSVGFKSFHSSLVLHHLRVIQLHHVCFHIIEVMPVFVHLIMMGAPNLHKLIILNGFSRENTSDSVSFWDSESAPNFTFERLKVLEMERVEMKFIKFLLASSPALETMIYRPDPSLTDKQLLNLTAELLTYRRASSNAQIFFSNSNR